METINVAARNYLGEQIGTFEVLLEAPKLVRFGGRVYVLDDDGYTETSLYEVTLQLSDGTKVFAD